MAQNRRHAVRLNTPIAPRTCARRSGMSVHRHSPGPGRPGPHKTGIRRRFRGRCTVRSWCLSTRLRPGRILGHLRIRRGDPEANSPLEEARALGGPAPELQRIGTLAAIGAEAAWLAGDREGVVREVQPAYEQVCQRRDPRMRGELAAWLWRVGALEQHPTDMAEPYAMEILGDWRGAARAWEDLGCPYEHATVLAVHGTESEQREALAIFEQLGAAPAAQALRKDMRAQGRARCPARLPDIDPEQSARPHETRGRDSRTVVRGAAQFRDRQAPVCVHQNGRPLRLGDLDEARCAIARRSNRADEPAAGRGQVTQGAWCHCGATHACAPTSVTM